MKKKTKKYYEKVCAITKSNDPWEIHLTYNNNILQ